MKMKTSENHEVKAEGVERQIVALHLANEIYGLDISLIHTVIMPQPITVVPQTPVFVRGVMNLRGQILPVIDMRSRFGLEPAPEELSGTMRIVIVDVDGIKAGLIVDAVSEVLRISESEIEPPSSLLASAASDCITGIGRTAKKKGDTTETELILLLDVKRALTEDASSLQHLWEAQAA